MLMEEPRMIILTRSQFDSLKKKKISKWLAQGFTIKVVA